MKNLRVPMWSLLLAAVGLLALGSVTYAMMSLRIVTVQPAPEAWLARGAVKVTVQYAGLAGDSVVTVDGRSLPVRRQEDKCLIAADASGLLDGPHRIEVVVHPRLGFGEVRRAWDVNVDTKPPVITLSLPVAGSVVKEAPLKVTGHTEPSTRLTVHVTPQAKGVAPLTLQSDAKGDFTFAAPLSENQNLLRVDAVDRAGNRAVARRNVVCDRTPPVIAVLYPKTDLKRIKLDATVTFHARVTEKGSGIVRATLRIDDGKPISLHLPAAGGEVQYVARELPQGHREVVLEVEDRAGWVARQGWSFLVDTTETFGRAVMTRGAEGRDVARLQKRLAKWGLLEADQVTSTFDEKTEWAVKQFQMRHKMSVDGVVGYTTIAALSPKIMIDLAHFTLTLVDGDRKVKTYKVAHGMPAYPTPAGKFRITFLEKDPTWMPPKGSVWAREARVTPPGPGNPLGTRWIGLNSNAVGIHGTNADWSIGSRASHGCVRMHIKDVEDLFDRINEGSEVDIFWERPHASASQSHQRPRKTVARRQGWN